MEEVCQEVGNNSQMLVIAIGVAVCGQGAGLKSVNKLSAPLGELRAALIKPLARLLSDGETTRVECRGPWTVGQKFRNDDMVRLRSRLSEWDCHDVAEIAESKGE